MLFRPFRRAWYVLANLLRKGKQDQELDQEVASYACLLSDEKVSQGMPEWEAQRSARLEIGGIEQVKEQIRERRTGFFLDSLLQDIRYGARMLRHKPGFTAVVVATLALGIGANTAMFSVVNATLLTPIPVPSPERVVMVWTESPERNFHHLPASVPDFLDWKASGVFQNLAVFNNDGFNIRMRNLTERMEGLFVSPEWFSVQGAKTVLGRTFTGAEAQPGHAQVVVLGWKFWQSHYQADPAVLGRSFVINGSPHTVIGVLADGAARVGHEEIYVPAVFDESEINRRGTRRWLVVGRIAPGVTLTVAQQRMAALGHRLAVQYPADERGQTLRLQPVEEAYVQDVKVLLLMLFGAVGFVLLVACANIANLMLARGTARGKEIAIRVALGASRTRVFCQLLAESLLLALLGTAAGIVPAYFAIRFIPKFGPELPNGNLISLNGTVLLFAFALALAAAVCFGMLPALQFWKSETDQPLRESERGQISRKQNRLGNVFVVAEIALTMVLLAGAGLMVRNFVRLRSTNPGYDGRPVLTMDMALTSAQFTDPKNQESFLRTAVANVSAIPGIESAAVTDAIPGGDSFHGTGLHFTDRPEPQPGEIPIVLMTSVSPAYFASLRIPLVSGRYFREADNAASAPVVMIDRIAAQRYWPHQDPIGKMIRLEKNTPPRKIVGIVGPVEQNASLRAVMGEVGQVYLPLAQAPQASVSLVVRSTLGTAALLPVIRQTIARLDRDVPLYKVQTLEQVRDQGWAPTRAGTILLALFGMTALLLAAMGIFGVISHAVGQRLREFGIRLAVGASAWDLLRLTLRRGAFLVGAGAGLGLLGAALLTRLMTRLLTGVSPTNVGTFALATLIFMSVGLLASYVPARRATKVDPTLALRAE